METKKYFCSDPYLEDHIALARAAAVKKWRGQADENAPAAGPLFTPDYLGDDERKEWQRVSDTSKP